MKDFLMSWVSIYVTKTNQDMKNYTTPLHSEKRFIKNQSYAIAEERLAFLDGERLGDLSIGIEDNATCRKIRRIMEKRVAQNFWRTASYGKKQGNGARYETRHHVSNHFKNIFGEVPKGFRYAA
ncbi:MAG: hypothetical protein SPL17_08740 [Bacteroidales bacterium]|nr:hypothetical protein [Bacteroidales bacterium]